jgi:hypothetical protein
VLLDEPCDGIEVLAALIATEDRPFGEGGAGGFDGLVDIGRCAVGDLGEGFAGRGIVGREGLARFGPAAIDEVAELVVVRLQPIDRGLW